MTKTTPRAKYTLEFKLEAARLVEAGQSISAAARTLGVADQTLFNWVKALRAGKLTGADGKSKVISADARPARGQGPGAEAHATARHPSKGPSGGCPKFCV